MRADRSEFPDVLLQPVGSVPAAVPAVVQAPPACHSTGDTRGPLRRAPSLAEIEVEEGGDVDETTTGRAVEQDPSPDELIRRAMEAAIAAGQRVMRPAPGRLGESTRRSTTVRLSIRWRLPEADNGSEEDDENDGGFTPANWW